MNEGGTAAEVAQAQWGQGILLLGRAANRDLAPNPE